MTEETRDVSYTLTQDDGIVMGTARAQVDARGELYMLEHGEIDPVFLRGARSGEIDGHPIAEVRTVFSPDRYVLIRVTRASEAT